MNKLCVVAKSQNTYFIKRLTQEVGESNLVFFNPWSEDLIPQADKYLVRTTGIYFDDRDLEILKCTKKIIINPIECLKIFREKNLQYHFFKTHKLPHLPWLYLKNSQLTDALEFLSKHQVGLIKPNRGQGGWGIRTLSQADFPTWWHEQQKKNDLDYLLQPYIQNAVELRIFFAADKKICLKRSALDSVAANFQQHGLAQLTEIPTSLVPTLEMLISASGAIYGAIDLLMWQSNVAILELNTVPGIEQLELVSGQNIVGEFLSPLI